MLNTFLALKSDLFVDQSDVYYKQVTLKDTAGVAINLTGYTLVCTIKKYEGVSSSACAVTVTPITPASGLFSINIALTEAAKLNRPRYAYNIVATSGSDVATIMYGSVIVTNF